MSDWYYLRGSAQQGPFPEPEFREMLQSGRLRQDTLVWKSGMSDWKPASDVPALAGSLTLAMDAASSSIAPASPTTLPGLRAKPGSEPIAAAPPIVPTGGINVNTLTDRTEVTAFALVCVAASIPLLLALLYTVLTFGVALILVMIFLVSSFVRHALAFAYYRVNAIQVSPAQFPEIYAAAADFARRLGRPLPEMYVMQSSVFNAFAMRLLGRPVVVLHSAVIDSILLKGDTRQLAFVVGHELGHHFAGHLGWKHFFASWGAWCIWPRLWYSRRCEFTCDRYGLACAGSLEAGQRAICHMVVGAQLADRVDLGDARRQWETRRGEFFVRYRALYSTHPHLLDRLASLPAASAELGVPASAN